MAQHESDAIVNFSWVHTFSSKLLLTVSPFYHYNSANYDSESQRHADRDHRPSLLQLRRRPGNVQRRACTGTICSSASIAFYQRDNELFGVIFNDGSGNRP